MKNNKLYRKLCHELRLSKWPIESIKYPENFQTTLLKRVQKWYLTIVELQKQLEMTDNEVIELGQTLRVERQKSKWEYSKKPIVSRRDNKTNKVGSGGSNSNKIRYPKKCRKTAWKRFYKLFPNLKPE